MVAPPTIFTPSIRSSGLRSCSSIEAVQARKLTPASMASFRKPLTGLPPSLGNTVSAMPFLSSSVPSMVKNIVTSFSIATARLAKKKGVAQRWGVSGPLVMIIITLSSAIFHFPLGLECQGHGVFAGVAQEGRCTTDFDAVDQFLALDAHHVHGHLAGDHAHPAFDRHVEQFA